MKYNLKKITKTISKRTVLVRTDYNVPLKQEKELITISDDTRIKNSLGTIQKLLEQDNKVVLMSHLGRPGGKTNTKYSLKLVANHLQILLPKTKVYFCPETIGETPQEYIAKMKQGELLVLENLRFNSGEKTNDTTFGKALADLADIYVNEAFSASHRAHASIVGVPQHLPSYAGLALNQEFETWTQLLTEPKRPFVMVIGGAKISDKVAAVQHLSKLADVVLVGGGTANNFLKAEGIDIHESYLEEKVLAKKGKKKVNYVKVAAHLLEKTEDDHHIIDGYIPLPKIIMPIDVIAAPNMDSTQTTTVELLNDQEKNVQDNLMYLDIGPKTIKLFEEVIAEAGTVFWNGPMGVFERDVFSTGTKHIGQAIAGSKAHSVIGGGDTVTAAHTFNQTAGFDFISTAGGAALDFLSGKTLPGLKPLLKD